MHINEKKVFIIKCRPNKSFLKKPKRVKNTEIEAKFDCLKKLPNTKMTDVKALIAADPERCRVSDELENENVIPLVFSCDSSSICHNVGRSVCLFVCPQRVL